ncbi:MAG: LptF/LptG family permease [Chloroherpetonaceae bacterium]|nr:LptF/LptG family permease [Chloroherpetonaceae bacterium]MDW8438408.1 LptF/LptG family permease [Chloroherpetonaceae bacterium]
MKILDRYIALRYLSAFLFGSLAFVAIFILIDLIEHIDDFIDRRVQPLAILSYYGYFLPEILKLIIPVSALLSALFVTGSLSKQMELTAMKAGGISLYRLLVPFFVIAAFITALDFYLSGWLVPRATREKQRFESLNLGKNFWVGGSRSNVNVMDSPSRLVSIGYYDDYQKICYSVSAQEFSGKRLLWRLDAERMLFDTTAQKWIFEKGYLRFIEGEQERLLRIETLDTLALSFTAKELGESTQALELMTLPEHRAFLISRERGGFESSDEAIVKYHAKLSFPFACLIVILIGVPLSAQKKRSGVALEMGISVLIGFLYMGVQQVFGTLGYKGAVHPVLAAWMPNLVFFGVGVFITLKAQK